jgi:tetratricopeptide (TPR) repeat protein
VFFSLNRSLCSRVGVACYLLFTACSNAPAERSIERIAVLPFENLTSDAALDWFGRGLANVVATQASGAAQVRIFEAATLRDAQLARATRVMQGYVTRAGGAVRIHATVRDEETRENVRTLDASGDVLKAGEAIVRELTGSPQPYTTTSVEAIQQLFASPTSENIDAALEADPGYGAAHIARVQALIRAGDREGAMRALEAARDPQVRFTEPQRFGLDLLRAQVTGNVQVRASATEKLAAYAQDAQLWREAGELRMALREPRAAVEAYSKASELEPENGLLLNSLGYARLFAGDFEGAKNALERYAKAAPESANPYDSLGELHFWFGQFADAERHFLSAAEKDESFLGGALYYRAALCRLMLNDHAKADAHMAKFFELRKRAGDQLVELRAALWDYAAGRRNEAHAALHRFDSTPLAATARAQAALWRLVEGDRDRAYADARQAFEAARKSGGSSLVVIASIVSQPSASAAEWMARVDRISPGSRQTAAGRQVLGWALLLDSKYVEATKVWREAFDAASLLTSKDERFALAWALAGAGKHAEARQVLPHYLLPPSSLEPGFSALVYPKLLEVKSSIKP